MCLIAIGTASAADFNQSDLSASDEVPVDLDEPLDDGENIGASMDDASGSVNVTSPDSDVLSISSDENDVLGDAGTTSALSSKLNNAVSGNIIDLENDYQLTSYCTINKPLTIDGHGYTINGGGYRIFYITTTSPVTLKNIKFTNVGQNNVIYIGSSQYSTYYLNLINCTFYSTTPYSSSTTESGAIYAYGRINLNITDCKFINGSGSRYTRAGYFTYGANLIIKNSTFEGNYNKNRNHVGPVFYFYNSYDYNVDIRNSTFRDNHASTSASTTDGGVMYFGSTTRASVKIKDSTFENNNAGSYGGVIAFYGQASLEIDNSTFVDNYAKAPASSKVYGGGIVYFASTATLKINNSTFRNNRAENGAGGVACFYSTVNDVTISNSTFDSNYASYTYSSNIYSNQNVNNGNGGVLYFSTGGDNTIVRISGSSFNNSYATFSGSSSTYNANNHAFGGVAYFNGIAHVYVKNSTFTDNHVSSVSGAVSEGGVFYFKAKSTLNIDNSTFIGNHAPQAGGVIFSPESLTVIISNHSTFKDNYAEWKTSTGPFGGGVLFTQNTIDLTIMDSEFYGNYAVNGAGGAIGINGGNSHVIFVSDSTFENNYAKSSFSNRDLGAGGVFYVYGTVDSFAVHNSTFRKNNASSSYSNPYNIQGCGGAIYLSSKANLELYDSTFDSNYAQTSYSNSYAGHGGAIYFYSEATLMAENVEFVNNTAASNGGAIYFGRLVRAEMFNATFKNNTARSTMGGAVYIANYNYANYFNVLNSTFENNYARLGGSVYVTGNSDKIYLNIMNSTFRDVKDVNMGGALHIITNANLNIENSVFTNITSKNSGAAIYANHRDSLINLNVQDSSFTDNSITSGGPGVAIYFYGSAVQMDNVSFINNFGVTDQIDSRAVYIIASSGDDAVSISGSKFINNSGRANSALYIDADYGNILIDDTMFINNTGFGYSDAAVGIHNGKSVTISNSLFDTNKLIGEGGALNIYGVSTVNVRDSSFNNNRASYGGAIRLMEIYDSVTIENSNFTDNRVTYDGAAIYFPTNVTDVTIDGCNFERNGAFRGDGGAIYFFSTSNNTRIANSKFIDNYVSYGYGGAVFFGSDSSYVCIENSLFKNNTAGRFGLTNDVYKLPEYYGGAIFVASTETPNEFTNLTFIDNKATRGGAIYYYGGGAIISASNFTGNEAHMGSAVFLGKTGKNSNSISDSYFADNPANSTKLDITFDTSSSAIVFKYAGGNNYINAIYSYDENINFNNVEYFEYDAGNGGMYNDNPSRHDYNVYQTIFVEVYDANDQLITSFSGKSDDEGKFIVNYPDLEGIKYVKAYRLADDYYTYIESVKEYLIGDFEILQGLINDLEENGVLVLTRNYTYTMGIDTIVDGIVIDKKVTIDGNGFYINALEQSRIFNLATDGIKLTNILFALGFSDSKGGAIYGNDVNDILIEDSQFAQSAARDGGAVYLKGNDNVIDNSSFISNGLKYKTDVPGFKEVGATLVRNPITDMGRWELMEEYLSGDLDLYNDKYPLMSYAIYGGAVYLEGSNLKIKDSNFTNDIAVIGGAVFINATDSTIENSIFTENSGLSAGVLFADGDNIVVSDSIFVANGVGGSIFLKTYNYPAAPGTDPGTLDPGTTDPGRSVDSGKSLRSGEKGNLRNEEGNGALTDVPMGDDVIYTDSTELVHKEYIGGGAIHMEADNSKVINSKFLYNFADKTLGGAIYWTGENGEVISSYFSKNKAKYGGAIYWDCEADNGLIDKCNFTQDNHNLDLEILTYLQNHGYGIDNYSNVADEGGAIFYDGYNGIISDSIFHKNCAHERGGAISLHANSTTVTNSRFDNNLLEVEEGLNRGFGGTAIFWCGNDGKLTDSNFTNHNSNYTIVLWSGDSEFTDLNMEIIDGFEYTIGTNGLIDNCMFLNNNVSESHIVEWAGYNGTISNTLFHNNTAIDGAAVFWEGTDGKIIDSNFTSNFGAYAAFLGQAFNTSITGCVFRDNVGTEAVVCQMPVYVYNSQTPTFIFSEKLYNSNFCIDKSEFISNYAYSSTVMDGSYNSRITNSRFYKNSNVKSAVQVLGPKSSIINTTFEDNVGLSGSAIIVGDINMDDGSIVEALGWNTTVSNSKFINNVAQVGGTVIFYATNGTVEGSNFTGNGLADYDYDSLLNAALPNVEDDYKLNNTFRTYEYIITQVFKRGTGAGINWLGFNGLVNDCRFENNSASIKNAEEYYGGAICWIGAYGKINSSEFINNFASKGGSVFWAGDEGRIVNSLFKENRIPGVKNEYNYFNTKYVFYNYADYDFVYDYYTYDDDAKMVAQAHYAEAYANISSSYSYDELEYISYFDDYHEPYIPKLGEVTPGYLELVYVFAVKDRVEFDGLSPAYGAGVYWYGEHGQVINSTFTNNTASLGGAIYWNGLSGAVIDSTFNENTVIGGEISTMSRVWISYYENSFQKTHYIASERDAGDFIKKVTAEYIYEVYQNQMGGNADFNEFTIDGANNVEYYVHQQQEILVNPGYHLFDDAHTGAFGGEGEYDFYFNFRTDYYNTTVTKGYCQSEGGAIYWDAQDLPPFMTISITPVDPGNDPGTTQQEPEGSLVNPGYGNLLRATPDSREILGDPDPNDVVEQQQYGYQPGYVLNSTFIKNSAENGGAIFWNTPQGIIAESTFINNSATMGGAVYAYGDWLNISASEFISNNAEYGGAVYMFGSGILVNQSSFIGNTATYGGAIYDDGQNDAILDSEFRLNKARIGSAIYVQSPIIYIANTVLLDNQAFYDSLIPTFVVDGNDITVDVIFSGKDNLMNAIYVSDDYFVQNVTYWSADGVTNSDIDVPSVSQLEAGQNITLELIDNAFNTITFVNVTNIKGETRIHAPKVKGGRYIVVVSHKEDNYYTEISRYEVMEFKSNDPELNVNVDDIYYHENATVNVKIDVNATGNVTIYLDGIEQSVENITGGVAVLNISGLKVGNYNVTVYYPGNSEFINSTVSTTFNVLKINSTIVVSTADVSEGAQIPVNVTVGPYDDLTGNVYVTIEGVYGTALTVNGRELKAVVRNLADGKYNISAYYAGDNNYYASSNVTNFTVVNSVVEAPVNTISANVTDITYLENTTANITVSHKMNGKVVIEVDGKFYEGNVVDGNALVNLYGLSGGVKTANVNFTSTNGVNLTTSTKFEVRKLNTVTDVRVDGRTVTINVTSGATGPLTVYINGARTDFNYVGDAITLTNALTTGNNTILAIYGGNENYTDSQNVTEAPIAKNKSIVNVTADNIIYGADALIIVNVGEHQTGYVTITVNNANYNAFIENNPMIIFNIPGLAVGNYPVTVKYSGDDIFASEVNSTDFNVIKANLTTSATVVGQNVTVLDNTSFIIGVPSNFNGTVNITVDGEKYSGPIESIITMAKLPVGDKVAEVVFWGDKNYNDFTLFAPFRVSILSTIVSVNVGEVTYPGAATANITVSGMANGTVVVTVDGKQYDAVEVINGHATVELGKLSAGIKNITANFTVTDAVNSNATSDSKFAVNKAATEVAIMTEDDDVVVNVTAGATGKLTVYVNGIKNEYEFTGDAIVLKNVLIVGNNTIVAIFDGNENYTGSQNTTNVIKGKKSSLVNVSAEDIAYGDDAVIVVRTGEGQTGFVTISVNGKEYSSEIIGGGATFLIPALNAASYPVAVRYSGDVNFTAQQNDTVFNVRKANLTASVIGQNVTVNDNTAFVITGVPANFNGMVNITVDGEKYSGDANSLIRMAKLTAGDKVADVVFYGDSNYNDLTLKAPFTVSRVSVDESGITTMTVTVGEVTYPNAATAVVTVSGHANGTVVVIVNGVEYAPVAVVGGFAVVDLGTVSAGVKNVTAKFTVSDLINNNATAETKFAVNKANSTVEIEFNGANVTVKVNPGETGKLTVYVNGVETAFTYTGPVTIENALAIGDNSVIASYEGSENYTGSQASRNATVPKKESLVNVVANDISYGSQASIVINVPVDQTGYVTIVVDGKNLSSVIKQGKATFNISGLKVNKYDVAVTYMGDGNYTSQVNSTSFNVNKVDLDAQVIGQNVTTNDNSAFVVSVPDDFTGKVNITVDGISYSGDVSALIQMAKLAAGDKVAKVVFWNDANYNDLTLDAPFTVSDIGMVFKIDTIKADNMTRAWNSEFDYQAAFLNKDGSALVNAMVQFVVNGNKYYAVTNEDGIAHMTGSKLDVGTYNVTSINLVTKEQTTTSLKIVKRITENKNIVMEYRDGTKFVVKVYGDNGTVAAEGEIISFYINGVSYVGKVDKTGHASIKINLLPKKYTIVAEYKGFKTSNKLVVKQILKVSKKTTKVKKSAKSFKLKATLKYRTGKVLKGKTITFKFKGKTYKAKTNKKGVVVVKIKKKSFKTLKKGKKYKVTVAYTIKEKYGYDVRPISDRVYCYVKVK